MTDDAPRRSPLVTALVVLGVAVVVFGLALVFFGVGAEMSKPRVVTFTVRTKGIDPEVAQAIKPGDPLYTDFAGMLIGRVKGVVVAPEVKSVPDAEGDLHAVGDPIRDQLDVTIEGPGREANGIVALSSQILQVGMQFSMVSDRFMLRGQVVDISVR